MKMNYIQKIQANIKRNQTVRTRRASDRVLDGTYKSVFKGRSMNFDELREYVPEDDIKDIDWKATARSQKVLVRQYIADRRHNVMLVFDTNKRMLGHSDGYEEKRELAIMAAGTLAYFVNKSGDYVASVFAGQDGIKYHPFKTGLGNIELILESYNKCVTENNDTNIDESLEYIVRHFKRKMIILVATDIHGINSIKDATLKKLLVAHDVLFLNMSDAVPNLDCSFDMEKSSFLSMFFTKNKKLSTRIKARNLLMIDKAMERFKRFGISCSTIDYIGELDKEIIDLLAKHKVDRRY